ncbi:MAG: hypothetical protein IJ764_07565 [Bacteroidales bacterium]|nr:hypothetical protein [Bacteroidales bacterium]
MRKIFLLAAGILLLFTSCDKKKTCRCSVADSEAVHVITIDAGECSGLNTMEYWDEFLTVRQDTLFCVEY